jgi:hypothetical protein
VASGAESAGDRRAYAGAGTDHDEGAMSGIRIRLHAGSLNDSRAERLCEGV